MAATTEFPHTEDDMGTIAATQKSQQTYFIVMLNEAEYFWVGVTIPAGMWYMK